MTLAAVLPLFVLFSKTQENESKTPGALLWPDVHRSSTGITPPSTCNCCGLSGMSTFPRWDNPALPENSHMQKERNANTKSFPRSLYLISRLICHLIACSAHHRFAEGGILLSVPKQSAHHCFLLFRQQFPNPRLLDHSGIIHK